MPQEICQHLGFGWGTRRVGFITSMRTLRRLLGNTLVAARVDQDLLVAMPMPLRVVDVVRRQMRMVTGELVLPVTTRRCRGDGKERTEASARRETSRAAAVVH